MSAERELSKELQERAGGAAAYLDMPTEKFIALAVAEKVARVEHEVWLKGQGKDGLRRSTSSTPRR